MSDSAPPMLDVREVKKIYRSGQEDLVVFEQVSFTVSRGSIVVISGESGCGKTTLLNLVGALDACSAGRIMFEGREITE
jgi:ABC-type lipoprotein export system ATPase subunit